MLSQSKPLNIEPFRSRKFLIFIWQGLPRLGPRANYGPQGLCNCPCDWYFIWIVQFATQLTAELRFGIVIIAIITVHRCPNIFIILKTLIKKQFLKRHSIVHFIIRSMNALWFSFYKNIVNKHNHFEFFDIFHVPSYLQSYLFMFGERSRSPLLFYPLFLSLYYLFTFAHFSKAN